MTTVVLGAQWGGEGTGTILSAMAKDTDVVVRFSGRDIVGHVIDTLRGRCRLHLLPSVAATSGPRVILGPGTAVDLGELFAEIDCLSQLGVGAEASVLVSDRAHLVLPQYGALELRHDEVENLPQAALDPRESAMAVAYTMKVSGEGLRVMDLLSGDLPDDLSDEDRDHLAGYRNRLAEIAVDASEFLGWSGDKAILLEGGWGALLDPDLGVYPFVAAGPAGAGASSSGSGLGLRSIDTVIGVVGAYSLRFDACPMPCELDSTRDADLLERLRLRTGEDLPRRTRFGHLDLVALRYSCRVNSVSSLALTRLDLLAGATDVKVCVAYETDAGSTVSFPASVNLLRKYRPVTRTFPLRQSAIGEARAFDDLPDGAQRFISYIEYFTGTPVDVITVGPDEGQTIVRRKPWIAS